MTRPDLEHDLAVVDAALAGEPVDPADAELAELSILLAADKPAPRPEWARSLDRRAEAGFPSARLAPVRRRLKLPALVLTPVAGLAVCVLVVFSLVLSSGTDSDAGDDGGSSGAGSSAGGAMAREAVPDAAPGSSSAAETSGDSPIARARYAIPKAMTGSGPAVVVPPDAPRLVERSTQLTLGVKRSQVQGTAQRVFGVAQSFGGIVDSSSVSSGTRAGTASFELRFPSDRAAPAVNRLAQLGEVRTQTSETGDVTAQGVSLDEQLEAARAERRGVLRALANAETEGELDSARRRLRIVNARIGGLRAQRESLSARVDYARVSLTIDGRSGATSPPAEEDGQWGPGDALKDAGRVLEVIAGGALVVASVLVPALVLLGLAWAGTSVTRRRRREATLDAAA